MLDTPFKKSTKKPISNCCAAGSCYEASRCPGREWNSGPTALIDHAVITSASHGGCAM